MYLEVDPRASPGKAMEGRVVDIEIVRVAQRVGMEICPLE